MQFIIDHPLLIVVILMGGLLANWLAHFVYAKKPAGCRWLTIAFAVIMLGMLLYFLIFLVLYERGVIQ